VADGKKQRTASVFCMSQLRRKDPLSLSPGLAVWVKRSGKRKRERERQRKLVSLRRRKKRTF